MWVYLAVLERNLDTFINDHYYPLLMPVGGAFSRPCPLLRVGSRCSSSASQSSLPPLEEAEFLPPPFHPPFLSSKFSPLLWLNKYIGEQEFFSLSEIEALKSLCHPLF